ncbi:WxL protein peptidoglycan domain-containing protein, partial [Enterococcus faecalis]|uniref:WxL protein peptidoglycan domain-containing protein n=1 Tax=Enterococcus faecalis TaxID=1351 RepID=UPI003984E543
IDKAIGYFDLLVAPEQNQILEVIISNSSDEERTFEVSANPAVTSDGGTIDYSQKKPTLDETLPFDVRDVLLIAKKEINVSA